VQGDQVVGAPEEGKTPAREFSRTIGSVDRKGYAREARPGRSGHPRLPHAADPFGQIPANWSDPQGHRPQSYEDRDERRTEFLATWPDIDTQIGLSLRGDELLIEAREAMIGQCAPSMMRASTSGRSSASSPPLLPGRISLMPIPPRGH
jgi:hypothetical protein